MKFSETEFLMISWGIEKPLYIVAQSKNMPLNSVNDSDLSKNNDQKMDGFIKSDHRSEVLF